MKVLHDDQKRNMPTEGDFGTLTDSLDIAYVPLPISESSPGARKGAYSGAKEKGGMRNGQARPQEKDKLFRIHGDCHSVCAGYFLMRI
jgi:hypothetical protein